MNQSLFRWSQEIIKNCQLGWNKEIGRALFCCHLLLHWWFRLLWEIPPTTFRTRRKLRYKLPSFCYFSFVFHFISEKTPGVFFWTRSIQPNPFDWSPTSRPWSFPIVERLGRVAWVGETWNFMEFCDVKLRMELEKTGFEMAWNLLVTSHYMLLTYPFTLCFWGADLFCWKTTRDVLYVWCLHISIIHFEYTLWWNDRIDIGGFILPKKYR